MQASAPDGVPVTDTEGVITPGRIDLHGHPEFNVFAAWEPPQLSALRADLINAFPQVGPIFA